MIEFLHNELIVGAIASSISTIVTWLIAKRKYNSEVDASEIQNLKDSLAFYKDVLEENQKLLKLYMEKVDEGMVEIHNLRKAVSDLLAVSCVDKVCKKRKMLDSNKAKEYLGVDTN